MKIEKCGNITLINGDCMEFMQSQSDKSFDLAIVDPPYGIDYAAKPARSKHEKKNWDNDIPNDIYFDELFRISNKCIIWGGNYYKLPPCQCLYFGTNKIRFLTFQMVSLRGLILIVLQNVLIIDITDIYKVKVQSKKKKYTPHKNQ